jgi:hypothetical protein
MAFGTRETQAQVVGRPTSRKTFATNYTPEMDDLTAALKPEKKAGLSLAQQWTIAGLILIGVLALAIIFPKGGDAELDDFVANRTMPPTIDGGYLKAPTLAHGSLIGGGCKWTVLRVTSESTYIARGLAWQSCPTTGDWYVESIYDCGSGRRRVLLGGDSLNAMGNQDFNGWEYLPHGLPQTKVANVACEAAGMKFVVNPRSRSS